MEPRIEHLKPKLLVGLFTDMSFADNQNMHLWKSFMTRRSDIMNRVSTDYISIQKYPWPDVFSFTGKFRKWAVVEVSNFDSVLEGMYEYRLQGGLYAVFNHNGPASSFSDTMNAIFENWLPASGYQLDDREHFEVLPEGYSPIDPNASEEIWIPISTSG